MRKTIVVRLPKGLQTPREGVRKVMFPVELVDNPFAGDDWQRRCRIEGLEDDTGQPIARDFVAVGQAALSLPADVAGELLLVVELANRRSGRRMTGSLTLRVDRESSSAIQVVTGNHHVEGSGIVYQPIEIRGAAGQRVDVTGDKLNFTVELFEENAAGAVAIETLLERHEAIRLPDLGDGITRVLALNHESRVVIGREYVSNLHDASRAVIERVSAARVHWLFNWEDDSLPQVMVALEYSIDSGSERLTIHNLTDYSVRRQPLHVLGRGRDEQAIQPRGFSTFELSPESDLELALGIGSARRTLARIEFETIAIRSATSSTEIHGVPLLRCIGSTFRYPPKGAADALMVRWLAAWIPWPVTKLRSVMSDSDDALSIAFDSDEAYLWIHHRREQRRLEVSSNHNLRDCLTGR